MFMRIKLFSSLEKSFCSRADFYRTYHQRVNKWRYARGLPRNPNTAGPLTDLTDYTFMDGRPTPLGVRQRGRVLQQRDLAQKIVTGIYEVDFAKERHQRLIKEAADEKQAIIDNKLKPKGHALMSKGSSK